MNENFELVIVKVTQLEIARKQLLTSIIIIIIIKLKNAMLNFIII